MSQPLPPSVAPMEELTDVTPPPANLRGNQTEEAALKGLLGIVNTPEFSEGKTDGTPGPFVDPDSELVPSKAQQRAVRPTPVKASPGRALIESAPVVPTRSVVPAVRKQMANQIFVTGRLRRGKDHILTHFGYKIDAFANPLYALCQYFFGTTDKSKPGVRKFLQLVGQWGRGVVNEQYPLTATRAIFTTMIRTLADSLPSEHRVNWSLFGLDENIWNDALYQRLLESDLHQEGRVGVTGCRFENEYRKLDAHGLEHWHVMCSPETWAKRLATVGLKTNSPEVNDYSEQMAIALDNDAMKHVKIKPVGSKLRVIWNDDQVKCPSPRFYTLNELE